MIKSFNNILTLGSLRWLKPRKLIEAINNSCRLVAEVFRGHEAVENTTYDWIGVRRQATCVTVSRRDTVNTVVVADTGADIQGTKAGTQGDRYKFFVRGLPEGLIAIGKSPDSILGLLYNDFIPYGDGYLFKSNPDKFGTVSVKSAEESIHFYCVGGVIRAKAQPQFRSLYMNTTKEIIARVVNHSINGSSQLAGIDNVSIHATAAVDTVMPGGKLETPSWTEGNKNYICIGSNLYSCPRDLNINTQSDNITTGSPVSVSHIDSIIVFPVSGVWYWLGYKRMNTNLLPEAVFHEYPEIIKEAPLEPQLRTIIKNRGIETLLVNDSFYSVDDIRILNKRIPITGSLHIVKHIDVSINAVTDLDVNTVDTIYLLYSDTGTESIKPGKSARAIRVAVGGTTGCMRVTNCVNNEGVIYAISSNSSISGARPSVDSKIYGIVAVIGGNDEDQDIIYSYKTIDPVSFGPGLEVILTVNA